MASASRWFYHPSAPKPLLARMDLGNAIRLFAGKGGERWLVHAREGKAEAAAMLADEDLVAVTRPDTNTFAFVGSGGTIYVASTPLGPFTDIRPMHPAPMRVAAAGESILAIHWDGSVSRSIDAGKTFSVVPFAGSRPFDVALLPDGRGVILGMPEQLWLTSDSGASWSRASTPTVGARFVAAAAQGTLTAPGLLASIVWRGEPKAVPKAIHRVAASAPLDLLTDLEEGPSASALASRHAAMTGTSYFEVARRDDKGPWFLARAAISARLQWVPIPESDECKHMTMGANGKHVVLGCLAGARRGGVLFPALRVIVSSDGGSTFTRKRPTALVADEEAVSLTVLQDDTVMISGACKPDTRGFCSPGAPMRLVAAHGSHALHFESTEAAKLPHLVGRVGRVHIGVGGELLYAKGQLASGPAVLISDDRGESFRAVALDLSGTAAAKDRDVAKMVAHAQPGRLTEAPDGTLSWVLYTEPGTVWVLLDSHGKVVSARIAPEGHPNIEAVGRHGLAWNSKDGSILESSDGGATFTPLTRLPPSTFAEEDAPLWCAAGGCVFGDSFSRTGWGNARGGIVSREKPKPKGERSKPPRTPIVCDLLESVHGDVENSDQLPSAADAHRGSLAWSALATDPKTGTVRVAHATDTPKHSVRLVTLFGPSPHPERVALHARTQAEGAAALRYLFSTGPDGKPVVGQPLRRIEVAWDNQFEGAPQHATLLSAGSLRAGDISGQGSRHVASANVEMLSIASGGIHVCPHAACNGASDSFFFLRARGPTDTTPIPPWPVHRLGGSTLKLSQNIMHVQGKQVPIAIDSNASVVIRASRRKDGSYAFPALAFAPRMVEEDGLVRASYWAYGPSGLMGLSETILQPAGSLAYARVYRFDTDEGVARAEPAPTQRDLSEPPPSCSREQRAKTFRIPSPPSPEVQHPVIIRHGEKQELLRTGLAVLYGNATSACVDVFDAMAEGNAQLRALIPVDAMDRSWLLTRRASTLHWQGMRCHFQPGAKIEAIALPRHLPAVPTPTGRKRPATSNDCEETFDRIVQVMPKKIPAAGLGSARDSFRKECLGKPVDMDCVRNASGIDEIIQRCIDM